MKLRTSSNKATSAVTSSSIGWRLFRYFAVFSVTIMLILWLLQILFIQTFYQEMKKTELEKIAATIEKEYGRDTLFETIISLTGRSDIYVQIQCGDDVIFETSRSNPSDRMSIFANTYDSRMLKEKLLTGEESHTMIKQTTTRNGSTSEAIIYASMLEKNDYNPYFSTYLLMYSPLSAVGTTIDILAKMLIIVTGISLVFGMIMSIIISRRLARPLHNIKKSAEQLAQGNYTASFDGSGYAETEALAVTLNYASEEISKADRLQKDLIANVSHDLKTPLTMVRSYAEMIRDLSGDNPEKRNRHLQVIINEADRLNGLVNDLTTLSKMQAKVDTLNPSSVDLAYIARETIESFSLHSEQDGFIFNLDTRGSTVVNADEKKIRQVFSNLIGNAVRYSGDNKNIEIKIFEKKSDSCVYCEVTDHGQGIHAADLDSIWDRYYQSSSNHSRNSKGSGLGLSIVKQIFILHNARYGVSSVENEGSTFWFELKK